MPLKPYPIANMQIGQASNREPWLLPSEAFSELKNMHIKRGVLEKRKGSELLSRILRVDPQGALCTVTEGDANRLNIECTAHGFVEGDSVTITGSTSYNETYLIITVIDADNFEVSGEWGAEEDGYLGAGKPSHPGYPVMHIAMHVDGTDEQLLVMDKERVNKLSSTSNLTYDIIGVYAYTGPTTQVWTNTPHGLTTGDIVVISECGAPYDGVWAVTVMTTTKFWIPVPRVADKTSGLLTIERFSDLTRTKIRFKPKAAMVQPSVDDVIYGWTGAALTGQGTVEKVILDYGTYAGASAYGTIVFKNGTVIGDFVANDTLDDTGDGSPSEVYGTAIATQSEELFTGDSTYYFDTANWLGTTYIVNGKDAVQKYDGTQLSRLSIDVGTDAARAGANDVTTAKLVFVVKNRLVLFGLTDGDGTMLQRARWSSISDDQSWPTANYKDAPTEDSIVAGEWIGDVLYIWFTRSIWKFSYTGDSTNPFEWVRVSPADGLSSTIGAISRHSVASIPGFHAQLGLGPSQIYRNDGNQIQQMDAAIPNFILNVTLASLPHSYVFAAHDQKQMYISYADNEAVPNSDGNIYPNRILLYDYEGGSWATYAHQVHCFGRTTLYEGRTWDADETWNEIEEPWAFGDKQPGYPIPLFGDHDGYVYKLNIGLSDTGSDIACYAMSARWNPFGPQGRKATLAFLDFLVDVDSGITFTVELYLDSDTTPYATRTVVCTAVGSADEMSWHRIRVGAKGRFHRIKIINSDSEEPLRIHAMVPHFIQAGDRMI